MPHPAGPDLGLTDREIVVAGVVKTDVAEQLIGEYEAQLVREPNNLKKLRDVADLYRQKKDFDKALQYFERIRTTEGGSDASLEKSITETHIRLAQSTD